MTVWKRCNSSRHTRSQGEKVSTSPPAVRLVLEYKVVFFQCGELNSIDLETFQKSLSDGYTTFVWIGNALL